MPEWLQQFAKFFPNSSQKAELAAPVSTPLPIASENSAPKESIEQYIEQLKLEKQYNDQVDFLNKLGLAGVLPESGQFGIVGFDGEEYPLPSWEEVRANLKKHEAVMINEVKRGHSTLIIVPFAVSLAELLNTYEKLLLQLNDETQLTDTSGQPLQVFRHEPVKRHWIFDHDDEKAKDFSADMAGTLWYFPKHFSTQSESGITKKDLLTDGQAYQFFLIDPQLSYKKTGKENIRFFRDHTYHDMLAWNMANSVAGYTPELWLMAAMHYLKTKHLQIEGTICLNTRFVPDEPPNLIKNHVLIVTVNWIDWGNAQGCLEISTNLPSNSPKERDFATAVQIID